MVSIKVMLNKSRVKDNETYPLVFQIIYRRQKKLIYTKYHLHIGNREKAELYLEMAVAKGSTQAQEALSYLKK